MTDKTFLIYSVLLSLSLGNSTADIISISESGMGDVPAFILFVSDEVEDCGPISSMTRHDSSSSDSTKEDAGLRIKVRIELIQFN